MKTLIKQTLQSESDTRQKRRQIKADQIPKNSGDERQRNLKQVMATKTRRGRRKMGRKKKDRFTEN